MTSYIKMEKDKAIEIAQDFADQVKAKWTEYATSKIAHAMKPGWHNLFIFQCRSKDSAFEMLNQTVAFSVRLARTEHRLQDIAYFINMCKEAAGEYVFVSREDFESFTQLSSADTAKFSLVKDFSEM